MYTGVARVYCSSYRREAHRLSSDKEKHMSDDTTTTLTDAEVAAEMNADAAVDAVDATETTDAPKATKPPVFDSRDEGKQVAIELGMRVKLVGDQDKDETGKPKTGTVTGIEYRRLRVVVKVDGQDKLIVRPAGKVFVIKTKNGKIERVERAVRAGRKAKEDAPAVVIEVAPEPEVTTEPTEVVADDTAAEDAPSPV